MSLILSDQPGLLGPKVEVSFFYTMLPVSLNIHVEYLMYIVYTCIKRERLCLTSFSNNEGSAENMTHGRVF